MKINARVLGWTDKCCGCNENIPGTEKVYMISYIAGVNGSIHLCEKCISKITGSQGIVLKNIDLTGWNGLDQCKKISEELEELKESTADYIINNTQETKNHAIEEYLDVVQASLGLLAIAGISAEEVMKEYPKHIEKLKNRPREKENKNENSWIMDRFTKRN
jgi:hypothetical protein